MSSEDAKIQTHEQVNAVITRKKVISGTKTEEKIRIENDWD